MQTNNRFFDDIAKMANGAMSAAAGVREEMEQLIRQQFERYLGEHDLVTYEEFAAVREQASKARSEQEKLAERVAVLEKELASLKEAKAKTTRRAPKQAKTTASAKSASPDAAKNK
ncbi:accessory factor UbiK family protein [Nisaea nitritireducens]|uniref:accessory factor UbiK family protein n=1 Tax=Nisaea nitritireducens TaxID=568392 RepID=UPI0018673807|nr:accessory factor UbiK family protein [Nisaea nitritireducens]